MHDGLMAFLSSEDMLKGMTLQQQAAGPRECCGIIIGDDAALRYVPLENQADRWHQVDPDAFPRDARTSYLIDKRALSSHLAHHQTLVAIVHTHIDCPSWFSEEDRRGAFSEDGQHLLFPGVGYAIYEVRDLTLQSCALYAYAPEKVGFACLGHVHFT